MVIAALLLAQLAAPLAELPQQELAPGQCALFLWDRASGRRIAMLQANPPILRLAIDGRSTDLPRETAEGTAVMGFAPISRYRSASRSYEVRLTILPATVGGAVVRDGSLTIAQENGDSLVLPVAGLAGCQQ
ncbi:hypothetical protein [Sandarakinorhabdus rubra]|uniref:hypothetical protein n=1 Tax=Sandarakinorhabdus rubra TaxID=2672568 RepID=UPI0013DADBCA|nr:hypothetical protein [Sandarakinorhabdus rubra]